jgi:ParB family chromosome partitioning protein
VQPRQSFSAESLTELSESIRQNGVIQPIEVVQIARHSYRIVHGERRWRAAQLAGIETIPAIVQRRDYDDVTRFSRQLVENIQREDLNDIDRAAGLVRLRELMQAELNSEAEARGAKPWSSKVTWAKVGVQLGYSRQRIHQLIQLLNLPEELRDAVRNGLMSERETRIYQGLSLEQQQDLYDANITGEINASESKQIAQLLKQGNVQSVKAAIKQIKAGEGASKPRQNRADVGNQVRLERVQVLLSHVRLENLDSAELELTRYLIEQIIQQADDILRDL